MAKPFEGAAYKCPFPAKHGGGVVLMRHLPFDIEERLRKKHTELGMLDSRSWLDSKCAESIVEVSPDIADQAGVTGGEVSRHGLIPVDATPPGRAEVWANIGGPRRELLRAAYASKSTVEEADIDPFLADLEDIV